MVLIAFRNLHYDKERGVIPAVAHTLQFTKKSILVLPNYPFIETFHEIFFMSLPVPVIPKPSVQINHLEGSADPFLHDYATWTLW